MSTTQKEDQAHMLYDLGNLMMVDTRSFDALDESEILARANKNFEGILQALLALKSKDPKTPLEYDRPVLEVTLPAKLTEFPRQRPIPKPKPLTKWEKFRVMKGLRPHQKKPRLVYDEITKSWVPRFGFGSKKHIEDAATGIVEDNTGIPLSERDPFVERKQEKKLRVEKQKLRELKNKIVTSKREKVKSDIGEALKIAQKSTASMGKFDKKLEKEPVPKSKKEKIDTSKWNLKDERKRNLDILKVIGKREASESVNVTKAAVPMVKNKKKDKKGKNKDKKAKQTHYLTLLYEYWLFIEQCMCILKHGNAV
eukprot:TRINITY_DN89276_c1_g1_i1.p3 TRINITY_DN89276_c1_g1~~TRINITY_DN89276_c1_g1_i1.p3  ORF type:complete len:311 (-),score=42.26 TRINITY_DN89276_c1_g1_i1:2018-2950(-)